MKDQDIDKLFHDGLSEASLPFDESAWTGAEKAIIAHEAAKRRRWAIFWILSGLLLISGGLGLYQYSSSGSDADLALINSETKIPQNNNSVQFPETSEIPDKAEDSDPNKSENKTSDTPEPKPEIPVHESANFKSDFENPAYGTVEQSAYVLVDEDEKERPEKSDLENRDIPDNQMNGFSISLIEIHEAAEIPVSGSSVTVGEKSELADWPLPEHWNTKVNLIAGVLPLDYLESSENELSRMPYYAGIGISKIHNYSWEFGTALLYEEMLYAPNEESIEQVEYGFGRTVTRHNIRRQRGAYLTVPVYAKYRIRNNHALMFGLQYSRLLQSYSSYSIERESSLSGTSTVEDQSNVSGFNSDLSQNQASVIFGYDLTLSDRLRFQVMGRLGANSLYKNSIQDNPWEDRVHLRIGLEYSIWRF